MMTKLAGPFAVLALLTTATAQRSLADLQKQFAAEAQQLASGQPNADRQRELLRKHTEQLAKFVSGEAKADDRWNGALMLADLRLAGGDSKGAGAALRQIDVAQASGLLLVTAATMAQHLGIKDLRETFVQQGLAKPAPLDDRLAMARFLTTVLREVDAGEGIYTKALAAATDDEQRALVRWHRCDALRDREDLPENAGFEELEKLAKELPGTYWGGVARDVLLATSLKVGEPAIPFRAPALNGGEIDSTKLLGKAVVLVFWSLGDQDLPTLLATLQQLRQQHGDRIAVVGVCLDRDRAAIADGMRALRIEFPELGDGKGELNDVALRWFVRGPTVHVIDKAGKMAGLGLQAGTADGRRELGDVVSRAVNG